MIPLYTNTEFESATSRQFLSLKCLYCGKPFHKTKHDIQSYREKRNDTGNFCSINCCNKHSKIGHLKVISCHNCGKVFSKKLNQVKKTKNHFCSCSCATKYNNTHKTKGTRRSKLEAWIEQQLKSLYPSLEIHFNRKDAINSELDVYIPSLKLAFELNGIFHYEPIYGSEKLASMKTNDHRKMLACAEQGIELCVLDVSSIKNFKPLRAQKFLDIITNFINQAISR